MSGITFNRQIRLLEQEPEETLSEVERFRDKLHLFMQQKVEEAEENIPNSPDVPIQIAFTDRNGILNRRETDPAIKLISISIAHRLEKEEIYDLDRNFESEITKKIIEKAEEYRQHKVDRVNSGGGTFHHPQSRFNLRNGIISIKVIPPSYLEEIGGVPDILEPLFNDLMSSAEPISDEQNISNDDELFKMVVNHEMTHAYIFNKLPKGRERLDNLDEGAAQAVTTLIYPSLEINIQNYRKSERYDRASLQTCKKLFLVYSRKFDNLDEKVFRIREKAVEVTRKKLVTTLIPDIIQTKSTKLKFNLTEAILGNQNDRLSKTYDVIRKLESVEEESFHALVLLNILPEEAMEAQFERINYRLSESINETFSELFPQEAIIDFSPHHEQEGYEQVNLEGIFKQGISDIDKIMRKEDLSEKEIKALKETKNDLQNALEAYKEEKKLESTYEEEFQQKYDEESKEIASWIKDRVKDPKYTDPVRLAKNIDINLERMIEDYLKIINTAIKYNSNLKNYLERIYNDEREAATIVREYGEKEAYSDLKEMIEKIQGVYSMLEESQNRLNDSRNKLHNAKKELGSLED